jgi:hypothetical protein
MPAGVFEKIKLPIQEPSHEEMNACKGSCRYEDVETSYHEKRLGVTYVLDSSETKYTPIYTMTVKKMKNETCSLRHPVQKK